MPEEPKDTDQILGSLSNLDTARMTVRWALERIRFLEASNAEMLELMKQAREAKDKALKEFADFRESMDKRVMATAHKEKFVGEMQSMLNSLFKGEVNIEEFLEQRRKLEVHKADLEAKAEQRVQEAEARFQKEVEDYHKRLAEMESAYNKALVEAQRSYQAELQDIHQQRQEESLQQQAKEVRFKEKLVEEVQKHAEQYHQKLTLMQFDLTAKREDLQREYEELKEKLFQEAKQSESRQTDAFRIAQTHWEGERDRLLAQLEQRERDLAKQHEALKALEQALQDRDFRRLVEVRQALDAAEKRHQEELQTVRLQETLRAQEFDHRLQEQQKRHHDEILQLQQTFDARLSAALEEHLRLRENEMQKRLESVGREEAGYREQLARASQEAAQSLIAAEARHHADLEALRREMEKEKKAVEAAFAAENARHAALIQQELEAARAQVREELESARAAAGKEAEARKQDNERALAHREKLQEAFEHQLAEELAKAEKGRAELLNSLREKFEATDAEHQQKVRELEQKARELQEKLQKQNGAGSQELREARERLINLQERFDERVATEIRRAVDAEKKARQEEALVTKQRHDEEMAAAKHHLETTLSAERQRLQTQAAAALAEKQKEADGLANRASAAEERGAKAEKALQDAQQQAESERTLILHAESSRKSRRRRLLAGALAALTLAAGGAGGWLYTQRGRDYTLPSSHPTGLAWDGDALWISDWYDQALYRMEPGSDGLGLVKKFPLPDTQPMGVALSREHVFVIDSVAQNIQRRARDGSLTLQGTTATPGPKPSALFYDGKYLWTADKETRLVYQHNNDERLSVLADFPLEDAAGVHFDGERLWIASAKDQLLSRHRPPPSFEATGQYVLPELETDTRPLSGLAWRDGQLWLAQDGSNVLRRRPWWRLRKR